MFSHQTKIFRKFRNFDLKLAPNSPKFGQFHGFLMKTFYCENTKMLIPNVFVVNKSGTMYGTTQENS